MTEKELILSTKPFAKEQRQKSWMHTLLTLSLILASIGVQLFIELPLLVNIGISVILGLLLVRMFIIYHDFLHKTILKGSTLAKIIFTFFGYYTLNPPSIWKRSHDHHHKHNSKLFTSSIGSFPIVTKSQFLKMTRLERTNYLFIRHPLTIAAGYIFAFTWGMCILSLVRSPQKHWDSALALIFHYSIGALIFVNFGWITFLLAFLIPAIISSGMGSYLFYAQHNFPTTTFEDKENWSYAKAALESSSFMKMNPVMQWFTGNIGYHHIHHLNALIPFYRLPEVDAKLSNAFNAKTTSLKPKDVWACLKIKVWDPEERRMLALGEIKS